MENVDIEKLKNFLLEIDPDRNVTNCFEDKNSIHLTTAYTWDNRGWNLKPLFEEAIKNGQLTEFDTSYFQIFTISGQKGAIAFNCPRLRDFDHKDTLDYSNALIEAREAIWRLSEFMKKNFKGFENAYISQIADMTGYRETNKIISKNNLTFEQILNSKPTADAILSGDYPFDVHSNDKDGSILKTTKKYFATIDSLISAEINNLYAAGRNLGADKLVQGALRIQASCMSMGEAVARHVKLNI